MLDRLLLSDKRQIILSEEQAIIRIHGEGSYCTVYSQLHHPITISRNLAAMERRLQSPNFLRVHQSHLVNLGKIRQIDQRDGCTLLMVDDSKVPVSRRQKASLLKRLRN
ncbi:MAG: LytTR family DNA-binding domain-containing protein [Bacteroidota bacterium]